jgi:hypothetical protein
MFESYCKHDKNQVVGMSFEAYKSMGTKAQITPRILTNQEYLYIYKAIMREKVKQEP